MNAPIGPSARWPASRACSRASARAPTWRSPWTSPANSDPRPTSSRCCATPASAISAWTSTFGSDAEMSQRTEHAEAEHVDTLGRKSALVIGVGGLGCPTLLALVRSGIGRVVLADDDEVSLSNLHRQLLFDPEDVGRDKATQARAKLA